MMDSFHIPILNKHGFQKIAEINYDLVEELFWNPEKLVQVSVMLKPPLVKCTKHYLVTGQTEIGETYTRDLNEFHRWLETHFSEFRLSFFFFRDIDETLALKRIAQKNLRETGQINDMDLANKERELELIREKINSAQNEMKEIDLLSGHSNSEFKLLNDTMNDIAAELKEGKNRLQLEGQKLSNEIENTKNLLREYKKKAVSAGILFNYSSSPQTFNNGNEFEDALYHVVKEVTDAHKFQVKQKLEGGLLQIFTEEINSPSLAFQIEWTGILNPNQLSTMGQPFDDLKKETDNFLSVFPKKDIKVDGHVKDEKKLFPAKAIRNIFKRCDKTEPNPTIPKLPTEGGWLGNLMVGNKVTDQKVRYRNKKEHIYASGTTTFGKSIAVRVIVENQLIEGTKIIVLDKGRQWCGLGLPNDKKEVLQRFDELGVSRDCVRAFPTKIYTPNCDVGLPLPDDLSELLNGCSVITLKGLDDIERCKIASKVLQAVHNAAGRESDETKMMIIIEEGHSILRGGVDHSAYKYADQALMQILKISREDAKYGYVFIVITQSISHFRDNAKDIRNLTNTKLFLKAADPSEHKYIPKDIIETVENLKRGEAVLCTSEIHGLKIYIRPPYSAVREPTDAEIRQINSEFDVTLKPKRMPTLSVKQSEALRAIQYHYRKYGKPMLAANFQLAMNIGRATRVRWIKQLVEKGVIKTIDIHGTDGRPAQGLIPLVE